MRPLLTCGYWCLAVMLAAGCGPGLEDGALEPSLRDVQELTAANGSNINGSNINGSNINGSTLGSILVAVSLAGATLGGTGLDSVALVESALTGHRGGSSYGPPDLTGAGFTGTLGDGSTVSLQLQAASQAAGSHVWRYQFAYQDQAGSWLPVCPGGAASVAVQGRWDYQQGVPGGGAKLADPMVFTLGCQGAAVEKCVTAGYEPWGTLNGQPLEPFHQACVRLMRADFCGDGKSWTTNGHPINLYDGVGVQQDTEAWRMEAEWDAGGARCFTVQNRSQLGGMCPGRSPDPGCGNPAQFQAGTLLMSEIP